MTDRGNDVYDEEELQLRLIPVCGNCGRIIHEYINAQELLAHSNNPKKLMWKEFEIIHKRCMYCGTVFKRINMPAKLPFNGY